MFKDKDVKMVWCAKGGENSNSTFDYLNFELNQCIKIKNLIPTNKLLLKYRLNKEIRLLKKLIKRCGE